MPIKPENRARYPKDWALRSRFVRLVRAKGRCEWCGAENGKPHPLTGSKVVLTCAHVYDHRPEAASLLNLASLCQRCHNRHDAKMRQQTAPLRATPLEFAMADKHARANEAQATAGALTHAAGLPFRHVVIRCRNVWVASLTDTPSPVGLPSCRVEVASGYPAWAATSAALFCFGVEVAHEDVPGTDAVAAYCALVEGLPRHWQAWLALQCVDQATAERTKAHDTAVGLKEGR